MQNTVEEYKSFHTSSVQPYLYYVCIFEEQQTINKLTDFYGP